MHTLPPSSTAPFDSRAASFLDDVRAGLSAQPKQLPCKYFYDARGSELFDRICELDEYYPTRCEAEVLRTHADAMAEFCGPRCVLIEYGSGSSHKTRLLLERLSSAAAYVPVDISAEHLLRSARKLAQRYSNIAVRPVIADFTQPFQLPPLPARIGQRVVFFSGSTIGNFTPDEAVELLQRIGELVGTGGGLLIGVDLKKDRAILERAYNDALGVTAEFNLNLLARINRELRADIRLERFRHHAPYNAAEGRVEMHLVSRDAQTVHLDGEAFHFSAGESICTEYSHKYSPEEFAALAARAQFAVEAIWTDAAGLYSVQYLRLRSR